MRKSLIILLAAQVAALWCTAAMAASRAPPRGRDRLGRPLRQRHLRTARSRARQTVARLRVFRTISASSARFPRVRLLPLQHGRQGCDLPERNSDSFVYAS